DLGLGQERGATESADVGDRSGDVIASERGIDLHGTREVGNSRIGLLAEPPAPGPHRASAVEARMLPGACSASARLKTPARARQAGSAIGAPAIGAPAIGAH